MVDIPSCFHSQKRKRDKCSDGIVLLAEPEMVLLLSQVCVLPVEGSCCDSQSQAHLKHTPRHQRELPERTLFGKLGN